LNEQIDKGFEELEALTEIQLPEDPSKDEFASMNQVLSEIGLRNNRVTHLSVKALNMKREFQKVRDSAKAVLDLRRQELLRTDEEVKAGKNKEEREALADAKLDAEVEAFEKANQDLDDAKALLTACDYVITDMKRQKELAGHKLMIGSQEISLGLGAIQPPRR
jgi:hypothetical protein